LLKVACRWPGRDLNPQHESYESDTLPLDHLHLPISISPAAVLRRLAAVLRSSCGVLRLSDRPFTLDLDVSGRHTLCFTVLSLYCIYLFIVKPLNFASLMFILGRFQSPVEVENNSVKILDILAYKLPVICDMMRGATHSYD